MWIVNTGLLPLDFVQRHRRPDLRRPYLIISAVLFLYTAIVVMYARVCVYDVDKYEEIAQPNGIAK